MIKTEYGTFAAPDTNRVIRNTYKSLALFTGAAAVGTNGLVHRPIKLIQRTTRHTSQNPHKRLSAIA